MLDPNSVVLRTTKDVTSQTTSIRRAKAECNRAAAWEYLTTPQAPDEDAWMGEMAQLTGLLDHSGTLAEVAVKYDRITELVEYDAMEDLKETDLLAALLLQRALRAKLLVDEVRLIAASRRKAVTWSRLAAALEMRNRQSAERRYLQLRRDMDDIAGHPLTQGERVEAARAHRDRRAEQAWAAEHRDAIVALARRLAAVPDLQQRADTCPKVTRANHVAALHARRAGERDPQPVRTAWPRRLTEAVNAEKAHRIAEAEEQQRPVGLGQEPAAPNPAHLSTVNQNRLVHRMFGLIGYAIDSDNVDLADHDGLVSAILALYTQAGPHAPRAPEDYAPRPALPEVPAVTAAAATGRTRDLEAYPGRTLRPDQTT